MLKLLKNDPVQTLPLAISEEDYNYDRQINDNSLDYHQDNNKSDNQGDNEKDDQNNYEIDNNKWQPSQDNDLNNDNQLNDILQEFNNVVDSDDIFEENNFVVEKIYTEHRNPENDFDISYINHERNLDESLKINNNLELWDHNSREKILETKDEHNLPYNQGSLENVGNSYENNDKTHDTENFSNNYDSSQNDDISSKENNSSNESN